MSYTTTIKIIQEACDKIVLKLDKNPDGRLVSAVSETAYLARLKENLPKDSTVVMPSIRCWYDIMINKIPFNLKITTCGTDNVFNKCAVVYTLTGIEHKNIKTYNRMYELLSPIKKARVHETEYHFIVVNKIDGHVIIRSLLDVEYKSNPLNIIQINWKNEFKTPCLKHEYSTQVDKLLTTIQKSLKQYQSSFDKFIAADMSKLKLQ